MPSPSLTTDLTAAASDLPPLLTCQQAAVFARVCDRTIRRMIASGRLRAAKTSPGASGRVLIPRDALIRLLAGEV